MKNLPVALEFAYDYAGVVNLHRQPGEPAVFEDPPEILALEASEDGAAYALVGHVPGPYPDREKWIPSRATPTGEAGGGPMVRHPGGSEESGNPHEGPEGGIPRYYQVLLKIRFGAGVPIETTYVRHRQLRPVESSGEK